MRGHCKVRHEETGLADGCAEWLDKDGSGDESCGNCTQWVEHTQAANMDNMVLIERADEKGGEDTINLKDLLLEAGYGGKFEVTLCKPTEDSYITVRHLESIDITPNYENINK